MADFVGNSGAKMRELLRGTVEMLKNHSPQDYLTKYVKGKAEVETANKRGFIVITDFKDNPSFLMGDPNGGSMAATSTQNYTRLTCNYQYMQVGSELTNETLANSQSGKPVGASAPATSIEKAAQRMLEIEEFYFCQGNGDQTIARVTSGTTGGTTVNCAGTADGFGAYFVKLGQTIRIYDSTLVTLKYTTTVTAKTSNTAFTVAATITIITGDLVLPEGDATTPTTTGIKGLPFIAGTATGNYFGSSKSTVSALKPIVDSNSGALSRVKIENLDTKHRIRNGRRMDTANITSPGQMSAYATLFMSGAIAHYVGGNRPKADLGLDSWDYTWYGKPIRDFRCVGIEKWYQLTLGSLSRVQMGEDGKAITPHGDWTPKVSSSGYLNAQQRWDDAYLEFFSANPAMNAALTALTFSGLPLLVDDTWV